MLMTSCTKTKWVTPTEISAAMMLQAPLWEKDWGRVWEAFQLKIKSGFLWEWAE